MVHESLFTFFHQAVYRFFLQLLKFKLDLLLGLYFYLYLSEISFTF